jgi:hypothetical protein
VKELEREGMRCGEGRGSHRPFIGAGGVTAALMALTPLMTEARLRGGLGGGWPEATRRSGHGRPAWGRGWS